MKKIIRLTESDLTNIVERVIKENSAKGSLIEMIKEEGWKSAAELVGGVENLKKLTGIGTPMDFLHLFDDMDVVQSEEKPNWTLFYYNPEKTIVSRNLYEKEVFVNYRDIGFILENDFNLKENEMKRIVTKWLNDVYDIRGYRVRSGMARYKHLTDEI